MTNRAITETEREALDMVARAAARAVRAEAEARQARADRKAVLRREWPVIEALGPTRISREIQGLIGEATIRAETCCG